MRRLLRFIYGALPQTPPFPHEEYSKIIRRIFHSIIGTCLFCVITLSGTPDAQLISKDATVKLPIINYDLNFGIFLIIGPVIISGLIIYLHIFLAQHRLLRTSNVGSLPALFNIHSKSAKIAK